jgi:alpha-D-ribose 1-methylphosphonate 5-triphosphate synthase subunit PhnH
MTIPTLTPRARREQQTFRALLNAMSRPGTVWQLPVTEGPSQEGLLPVAEALVDHEVTFAAVPDQGELVDSVLRQTGSRVAAVEDADYVFCRADSLQEALRRCKDGTPEYPDASATVICAVDALKQGTRGGDSLTLSGPGIRDEAFLRVAGLGADAVEAFRERNASPPLGVDLVFVAGSGQVVCLSRYTRLQVED